MDRNALTFPLTLPQLAAFLADDGYIMAPDDFLFYSDLLALLNSAYTASRSGDAAAVAAIVETIARVLDPLPQNSRQSAFARSVNQWIAWAIKRGVTERA